VDQQKARDRQRIHAENEILALHAGVLAQAKFAGHEIDWRHGKDYRDAADLATSFVSDDDDVRHAFLVYCKKRSAAMVEAWWPEIQALAHALMEQKTLTPREVREVIAAIPAEVYREHRKARSEAFEREQERLLAEYWKQRSANGSTE
jgi:hypothetical protein